MSNIRTWPARIWLQREEREDYPGPGSEVTWCQEAINDADVEYVRVDLYNSLRKRAGKAADTDCQCGPYACMGPNRAALAGLKCTSKGKEVKP